MAEKISGAQALEQWRMRIMQRLTGAAEATRTEAEQKVADMLPEMAYKGSLTMPDAKVAAGESAGTDALPTQRGLEAVLGWAYVVEKAGVYAGQSCKAGDLVVCVQGHTCDGTKGTLTSENWAALRASEIAETEEENIGL